MGLLYLYLYLYLYLLSFHDIGHEKEESTFFLKISISYCLIRILINLQLKQFDFHY